MAPPQELESRIQPLSEALTSERSSGEVRFSLAAQGEDETDLKALDERAKEQEFRPLGDSWRPLSRVEAEALLGRVPHLALAYDSESLEPERARELVARFCDLFGPEGRFFSNADATTPTRAAGPATPSPGPPWIMDED
ncbi:hypothetical protein JQX13_28995 [Archangium violaceum]|uniref:hypothetical protein n=1 Tax=Archangium violaceum TaxID=83451 RepID=UPI00193BE699|nr:hypothetical protein [Archangium violaceum]QRK04301.1 hypothetical protein JQX13_28995 [Archangium violaceum]